MRIALALLVVAACGSSKPAPTGPVAAPAPVAEAPVPPPPVPPPPPPALDDAGVKTQSLALMTALDQRDAAAMDRLTGDSFTMYERARTYDKARVLSGMQARTDQGIPQRSRTCVDGRITRGPAHVVYVVECTENLPAYKDLPAGTLETIHTIVWIMDRDGYRAQWWSTEQGGLAAEADFWDTMYRTSTSFRREPNRHLVAAVEGRKPGTALDIMMGQGRNAVYLATTGWKVTGVDVSKEGVRQAVAAAAKQKRKLTGIVDNIETWDMGTAKWDLVTMIYAGSDAKLIARAQAAVKPGGLFVIEYFHADGTAGVGVGGFTTDQLTTAFASGWKIITDEVVEDTADFSLRTTKLVRFTAQKL